LLGVEWLDGTTPVGEPMPPVLALQPDQRTRRTGVEVLRSPLLPCDVVRVKGLPGVPVTSPVRTAFDLARTAPSLTESVVALDAMARHGVTPREVARYAAERAGWKGVRRAREAAALAIGRVRSSAESRWRMLWVLEAGLPCPLVNAVVVGPRGERVAEVDLLDRDRGLVGEYDGSPHSDADARAHDSVRQERLQAVGLVVVRVTSVDLSRHRARTTTRLQDAARRAQPSSSGQWGVRIGQIPRLPLTRSTEWSLLTRHAGVSVSK
jgi:hypothetical protein